MTTYSELLRDREMRALFVGFAALVAGSSLGGLALATLVSAETGSPLLTALSMFGPTLANVLGAATVMSLADAGRPRHTLVAVQLVATALVLAQLVPGLPVAARLALVIALGLATSLAAGVRLGLLTEVAGETNYATARSLLNVATGSMQIVGFAAAALLLTWFTPRGLFAVDAACLAASTLVVAAGVREHSARPAARPGLAQTLRTNRWLVRQRPLRPLMLNLCVPNGLIVGCEALFVPYAGDSAGVLFVAGALGMLAGDLTMGRFVDRRLRKRLGPWLRVLLAAPYLAFALSPALVPAALLVVVASVGYSAGLSMQERLVELTPDAMRGQVQGVEGAARMTMQGVGALLAGAVAERVAVGTTMTLMALASLAITLTTIPAVRRAFADESLRAEAVR